MNSDHFDFDLRENVDNVETLKQMHESFTRSVSPSIDIQVAILRAYAKHFQYDLDELLSREQLDCIVMLLEVDYSFFCVELKKGFDPWVEMFNHDSGFELRLLLVEDKKSNSNKITAPPRLTSSSKLVTYMREFETCETKFDLFVKMMRDYVNALGGGGGSWLSKPKGALLLVRAIVLDAVITRTTTRRPKDGYGVVEFAILASFEFRDILLARGLFDDDLGINLKNLFDDSLLDDPAAYKEMENRIRCQDCMDVLGSFVGTFIFNLVSIPAALTRTNVSVGLCPYVADGNLTSTSHPKRIKQD
jgi:hypothetical protein